MPNGVKKSQRTAHANGQRVKMAEKHTAEMDALLAKHSAEVAELDLKNRNLTEEIALAVKKLEKMEDSTQVEELRKRLKVLRVKEREFGDKLLKEVAETTKQRKEKEFWVKKYDDFHKSIQGRVRDRENKNIELAGGLYDYHRFLLADLDDAELGFKLLSRMRLYAEQERDKKKASPAYRKMWSDTITELIDLNMDRFKELAKVQEAGKEKIFRDFLNKKAEEVIALHSKTTTALDQAYQECWCRHDNHYRDPVIDVAVKTRVEKEYEECICQPCK